MELILASGSPRRQQMLRDLGVEFKVVTSDVDESRLRGEPAAIFASRLAKEKAECVVSRLRKSVDSGDWAVLAADTIVVLGTQVLGKPASADEGARMLRKLSGRTHEVLTAYCWIGSLGGKARAGSALVRTKVTFASLSADFWQWYVSTGEPMDKAGAYAAQGIGMSFIERVSGSYSNVVGLPLPQVLQTFRKLFGGDLREYCAPAR